jgi:acetoacetate decarboxylase
VYALPATQPAPPPPPYIFIQVEALLRLRIRMDPRSIAPVDPNPASGRLRIQLSKYSIDAKSQNLP